MNLAEGVQIISFAILAGLVIITALGVVLLENIVYSGTKVDINYYIDEMLDDDQQEEIFDYFKEEAKTDSIEEAMGEFEEEYDEEELRLMRIKFLSDFAN